MMVRVTGVLFRLPLLLLFLRLLLLSSPLQSQHSIRAVAAAATKVDEMNGCGADEDEDGGKENIE